jgi:hypothetical protein
MHIDSYGFGTITIDGKDYRSDVIIYPDQVDSSWWRKEGHYLQKADVSGIVAARPDILIVGTGMHGVMTVPQDTMKYLESHGIEVRVEKTGKAVDVFNAQSKDKKVIAALHLTC